MSALGELSRPVPEGELKQELETLAIRHLTQNGDTNISFKCPQHNLTASNEIITVYEIEFCADAGTAILRIAVLSDGDKKIEEI